MRPIQNTAFAPISRPTVTSAQLLGAKLQKASDDITDMMARERPVHAGVPYVVVDLDGWAQRNFGMPVEDIRDPALAKGVADILEDAAPGIYLGQRMRMFDLAAQLRNVR